MSDLSDYAHSKAAPVTTPTISVIIPNYNQSHYLPEAINSVLDQSYRNFEIIVVDDGSTDNCREVLAPFRGQIRYLRQANRGLAAARNTGLRAARGALIGLLDADDRWLPDFLTSMLGLTVQHPEAVVYYCSAQSMNASGGYLPQVYGVKPESSEPLPGVLLRGNFLIPSTVLLRKQPVLQAGGFDEALRSCEDWDLWLRLLKNYSFAGIPASLVAYRVHPDSLSRNTSGMCQAVRAVVGKHFGDESDNTESWSLAKLRAYGGMYRYFVLSAVQTGAVESEAAGYLRRALYLDATLAHNLDTFYDLALGDQPPGYRIGSPCVHLKRNARYLLGLLAGTFDSDTRLRALRRATFGTACHAIGRIAYNSNQHLASAGYLLRAAWYQPSLYLRYSFSATLVKTLVPVFILRRIKQWRSRLRPVPVRSLTQSDSRPGAVPREARQVMSKDQRSTCAF